MRPPSLCRRCASPVAGDHGVAVRLVDRADPGCWKLGRVCGPACLAALEADPKAMARVRVEVLEEVPA